MLNKKFKCVKSNSPNVMNVGDIKEFIDGQFMRNDNDVSCEYTSIQEFNNIHTNVKIELYIEEYKLIITDRKVIILDKQNNKKGISTCHPEDEFDISVGFKLAWERLQGKTTTSDFKTGYWINFPIKDWQSWKRLF